MSHTTREELIAEMDGVLDELKKAQDAVHVELLATKAAARVCRGFWDFYGTSMGLPWDFDFHIFQ